MHVFRANRSGLWERLSVACHSAIDYGRQADAAISNIRAARVRDFLIHLPEDSELSLQAQIRESLVGAILDGQIPPGSPLPSSRQLCRQLGVARNTVVIAYQQLIAEGYLVSRERSGVYVSDDILAGRVDRSRIPASAIATGKEIDWDRRFRIRPSMQRNIVKPKDWQAFPFPFIYGQFDPALFPIADWRECSRQALSPRAVREWASDSVDHDDAMLVEQIRTRILPRRGVLAQPEQILVTMGAQHALYLLGELLFSAHTRVGIEDPGYPDARNSFALRSSSIMALPVDGSGVVLGEGLDGCDYLFLTPSHQFPTTVTLPLQRRREILRRAAQSDFFVIEDDYESETSFVGKPTAALKSLDSNDRVIYVGSLSKTLAPGLRLGFLVAPPDVIREARALRRLMLRHPPANNQRSVALFLAQGHHDSLVRRLGHALRERWEVMGQALDRHLPDSSHPPGFGGTSYWVKGPSNLDARDLRVKAAAQGILIESGDVCFASPDGPKNFFRLGFGSISADRIEPGIERLAGLIRERNAGTFGPTDC